MPAYPIYVILPTAQVAISIRTTPQITDATILFTPLGLSLDATIEDGTRLQFSQPNYPDPPTILTVAKILVRALRCVRPESADIRSLQITDCTYTGDAPNSSLTAGSITFASYRALPLSDVRIQHPQSGPLTVPLPDTSRSPTPANG